MRKAGQTLSLTIVSITVMLWSWHFGVMPFLLVGTPIVTLRLAVAGGARAPWKIPAKDYLLYFVIALGLAFGVFACAKYAALHGG